MNRLLATLLAGCFSVGVYAHQAPVHTHAGGMTPVAATHAHKAKSKKHHAAARKGQHGAKHAKAKRSRHAPHA
ncbi:hypothetical protein [Xylophilus sp. ASV27]|uniref:hypothetical protein n=1 Tax=Xylophilus sp. ASV27 TaxID=2795129 RepID=UPI0018EC5809|nr:hypothetical protein [Xylophilus sp. ASV27]